MVYAFLGIPITFLCLANLGNLMAKAFRFGYRHLCCSCCYIFECNAPKRKRRLRRKAKTSKRAADSVQISRNLEHANLVEQTNLDESIERIKLPDRIDGEAEFEHEELELSTGSEQQDIEMQEDLERVPISLVFCLIFGYISLGGFMFARWEGWHLIEGTYFCFTTLTTIGFGDLLPGSAKFSRNELDQIKFVICCVYMLVGLSLIAMSFNLVQEEIVIKFRRLGRRLGILPDNVELTLQTPKAPSSFAKQIEIVYV